MCCGMLVKVSLMEDTPANLAHVAALRNQHNTMFVTRVHRFGFPGFEADPIGKFVANENRYPVPMQGLLAIGRGCPLQGA